MCRWPQPITAADPVIGGSLRPYEAETCSNGLGCLANELACPDPCRDSLEQGGSLCDRGRVTAPFREMAGG
jgi:hypothetical protein